MIRSIKKALAALGAAAMLQCVCAAAMPIDAFADEDESIIRLCDTDAEAGKTAEVKVDLSGNYTGIAEFRLRVKCPGLEPDRDQGIGGYIAKSADDILYNYGTDSVLIVWGSGDGNTKLVDDLSEFGYSYNKAETKDFFTVYFKIPEDAKVGDKYNVMFDGDTEFLTADESETYFTAKSGTITVTKEAEPASETEKESAKAVKETTSSEKTSSKAAAAEVKSSDNGSDPLVPLNILGIISLIAVGAVSAMLFITNKQMSEVHDELSRIDRLTQNL